MNASLSSSPAQKLSGKVALVTGGTSGIGLATAARLAADGAHVYIVGRRQEKVDEAVAALRSHGAVVGIRGDVARPSDLEAVFSAIASDHGQLDIVFANAGGGSLMHLGSITEEHIDSIFDSNVKGVIFTVQQALPLMKEGGSIILNASTTSVKGTPAFSVYSASKAAVRNLARSWILELKERRIRVNVVSPGVVPTAGYDGLGLTPDQLQGFIDTQAAVIPAGRVGSPEEIAAVVSFLGSSDSSFINGVELFVDGGMTQV